MHLQFAYYESALVVEFLVERFGYKALKAILADLATGEQINTVISRHAAPLEKIEKEFEAFATTRAEDLAPNVDWEQPEKGQLDTTDLQALAEWLAQHPNNFWALTLYAKSLLADRKWADATVPLQKLIELYPQYTGDNNGYLLLAEAHRNLSETELERQVLTKLATISGNATYAYGRLMEIAVQQKNWQDVVENGQRYMAVNPLLSSLHWQLGRANEELGRDEQAIESYRRLLLLDPADPADVHYRLGRLLQDRDPAAAKRHVLTALAEAPRFRQAHRLLLKLIYGAPESRISDPRSRGSSDDGIAQEDVP
jgi:tetratricopeptide (TPR) repeat protein